LKWTRARVMAESSAHTRLLPATDPENTCRELAV
jgi:hypothetical protein